MRRPSSPTLVVALAATLLLLAALPGAAGRYHRGCTRTRGYWSTHHCRAGQNSDSPRRISWPPTHPDVPCYNEDAMFLCDDLTGYGVFDLSEADGNVWVQAAKQLRAFLNNQNSGASVPPEVQDAADALEALLVAACDTKEFAKDSPERTLAEQYKTYLDLYNNGQWPGGPDHCDDGDQLPCVVHAWSEWSACSSLCAGEVGERSRTQRTQCPDEPDEIVTQTEACDSVVPCCEWSAWSCYGECSALCGDQGVRHSTRTLTCLNTTETPTETRSEPCNRVPCCEDEVASEWSVCSVSCGDGGVRSRVHVQCCLDTGTHMRPEEEPCSAPAPCCPPYCLECDGQGDCLQCEPYHHGPQCEYSPCVECLPHRFGAQCAPCPAACPQHCSDGLAGDGSCIA